MKTKILALLVALSVTASAQPTNSSRILLAGYNLLAAGAAGGTPVYCAPGTAISTASRVYSGTGGVVSSSTTLTAVSGTPFAGVTAGAMLLIVDTSPQGVSTTYRRSVTVATSSTTVVISGAAVTITSGVIQSGGSANPNGSTNMSCGTTSAFGWFSVAAFNKFSVQVDVTQNVNTGGLQFHLQCRESSEAPVVQVYPVLTFPTVTPSYTSALASTTTGSFILSTQDTFTSCRVGMMIATTDDGNDLTTNAEQISITLTGRAN